MSSSDDSTLEGYKNYFNKDTKGAPIPETSHRRFRKQNPAIRKPIQNKGAHCPDLGQGRYDESGQDENNFSRDVGMQIHESNKVVFDEPSGTQQLEGLENDSIRMDIETNLQTGELETVEEDVCDEFQCEEDLYNKDIQNPEKYEYMFDYFKKYMGQADINEKIVTPVAASRGEILIMLLKYGIP